MQHDQILLQVALIFCSTALFGAAIYLLSIYNRLYNGVRSLWLRHNLSVLTIGILVMAAFMSLQFPELLRVTGKIGVWGVLAKKLFQSAIIILFVFNIVTLVSRIPAVKSMSFIGHHAVIFIAIVFSALFIYGLISYIDNGMNSKELHGTLVYAYFNSALTGLIYTGFRYVELERKRKLSEKEHEVTKLMALKTKAELDALHSKVNPHFLYNALNSIADLSITDGKKARRMTIALADLFRYSINYTQNNYSTVNDEVAMTEVYLQIEKIRFEDQLNYSVKVEEEAGHYLVPRFLLQPIVENAVKHGLKATGKMTEILLEVKKNDTGLEINIADNGPLFPDELSPGYGVKSVFDKLDLLFPGQYAIHFRNEPRKEVSIHIHKLMKNEPGV
ncbi:MAG: histidine kinase [Chitinophagaceae bacterium]|nr:histidine kinase [Chitinophagaceae bacterium]